MQVGQGKESDEGVNIRMGVGHGAMNCVIRDAVAGDIPAILEIYRYYVEQTAITFEYVTPSAEEMLDRMKSVQRRYPYLVLEWEGRVVGYAYAGVFKGRAAYDRSCEMTIYLSHRALKQGFGRRLYTALEERLTQQGMLNLYACIGMPVEDGDAYLTRNSAEFHAHLGFVTVGTFHLCGYKFNRWYDMIWMEKMVGEHTNHLPPVVWPEA